MAWLATLVSAYRPLDAEQRLAGFARIVSADVIGPTGYRLTQPGDPDVDRVKRRLHVAHIAHAMHELRPGDEAVVVPAKRARRRSPRRVVAFERSA